MTHKKRGRPPLRAEESLLRHFDSPFGLPDPSREPQLQMSPPLTRPTHRRASSSREIRPVTELRFPRLGDPPVEHGRVGGIGIPPRPPLWATTPAISSSPQNRPTSSPIQADFAGQRPFSSGSSRQSAQPPSSPYLYSSPGGATPRHHPSPVAAGRASALPQYRGFGPPITQPQHQQHSSLPAPFTPYYPPRPRSPHRPPISEVAVASNAEAARNTGVRPHSAESRFGYRLPPIWPSPPANASESRRADEMIPPPSRSLARTSYEQPSPQHRLREPLNRYPEPLQPAFQGSAATSAPQGRPMTAHQLPPSLQPPLLPPPALPTRAEEPPVLRGEPVAATTPDGETDENPRPAKRLKMALGDMVNN